SPRAFPIGARPGGDWARKSACPRCSSICRRPTWLRRKTLSARRSPIVRNEAGNAVSAQSAIALSLISHTNAGKTTLARTLLGRDVGSVRDAQQVTQDATWHPLIETPQGDALVLWDTPGFGDSARLARRLAQQQNPIGWFLSQ